MKKITLSLLICLFTLAFSAACTLQAAPPTHTAANVTAIITAPADIPPPEAAATATLTPPAITDEAVAVLSPTASAMPTNTDTPADTATPTIEPTAAPTETHTLIPTPAGTQPLYTLTPPSSQGAPPDAEPADAPLSATSGWTCDDFPCEDDIAGFLQRIQVPDGYRVEHVGRFPGKPMQITYGRDGRLYATVLENGTRRGAVYVMDADGTAQRYSGTLVSPLGLAFQPGTDVLYVSAREVPASGGVVWRIPPSGEPEAVISGLPCCFSLIDNQPNGMIFGADGYLYLGVGSLTDSTENPPRSARAYAEIVPYEASILRIQPHTGEIDVYANGIRNPFDLAIDSAGQLYATDNGLVSGEGDRVLKVEPEAHYGWPYWWSRGCTGCPTQPGNIIVSPDLLAFPDYTLPRGIVAYTGAQFPANLFDNLFVTLWNGVEGGQRVVRIDPQQAASRKAYTPQPFVTGLIRPIDVTVAPDGSLVVADYVYGHVWRVVYERSM